LSKEKESTVEVFNKVLTYSGFAVKKIIYLIGVCNIIDSAEYINISSMKEIQQQYANTNTSILK